MLVAYCRSKSAQNVIFRQYFKAVNLQHNLGGVLSLWSSLLELASDAV